MSEEQQDSSQKTEQPSPRKLEKAREEGNVIASREMNTFFLFCFFTLFLFFILPFLSQKAVIMLMPYIVAAHDIFIDGKNIVSIFSRLLLVFCAIIAVPFFLIILSPIVSTFIQHNGLIFATKALKVDLQRISPLSGFRRIFSAKSVVELMKNILKILCIGFAIFLVIHPELQSISELYAYSWNALLSFVFYTIVKMFFTVCIIMAILALLDYLYQRHSYMTKMKMTKQELKEETKQSEGDQAIKAKMRQIRLQRMRKRMLAAVPKATVVITNPTHYAVALRYISEEMNAPELIAKGQDYLALKIKEVAQEHNIPIIENKILARALYESVEIDETIPYEYYKAVADIIAYIMKLKPGYIESNKDNN